MGNWFPAFVYYWESNPWHVDVVNWNKNHCFLNLAVNLWLKGVNLNYTIGWVWESNQETIQVWNRNPFQVSKGDSNPWLCCKIDSKQYKCSNLGIEPMNHVLWDKILVYLSKIFFKFLYLGDGFCPLWGCYYCLLWNCSLFIWVP